MERFFNTAGPVNPDKHYCIPLEERVDMEAIMLLIRQEKYFILHAPRQTGKTSVLIALMHHLNASGMYKSLYINVEAAQAARENVEGAMQAIAEAVIHQAEIYLNDPVPGKIYKSIKEEKSTYQGVNLLFSRWAKVNPLPLVIFIDEIDSLIGDTLISVLRQIRTGYPNRPKNFPQSLMLCGVRDVRDYRIHSSHTKEIITGGSAYNIKAESLRLGDFSQTEIKKLLLMHTHETGQIFAPGVIETFTELTCGQPWLVNALAYECCFKNKITRSRSVTITREMVKTAAEIIIQRRETHLDQLTDKLKEERVRRVLIPILNGESEITSIPLDDAQYVEDLGLIRRKPQFEIANPIYREVIPRVLVDTTQDQIHQETIWYVNEDGRLDMKKLLSAFQQFFREHSEHWIERFDYKEAGPQLLMQAFLQRIVNGGGRVEREYALGSMRTDLFITWPYNRDKKQIIIIELKIKHGNVKAIQQQGAEQVFKYMDKCKADEGYLIIFDKTPEISWDEKVFHTTIVYNGIHIPVWGM